jgi:hypothetical protein
MKAKAFTADQALEKRHPPPRQGTLELRQRQAVDLD